MDRKSNEWSAVLDVDLCGLLRYHNHAVRKVSEESGRIALWFDADAVRQRERQLATGRATVRVDKWSTVIRRLHQSFFSPAAKSALRGQFLNG